MSSPSDATTDRNNDWDVGIDVGGTFTDLVAYCQKTGQRRSLKRSSTPDNQSFGILDALKALTPDLRSVVALSHGNTVALNTILERRGARVGIITTDGFGDVVEIGKTNRLKLFDLRYQKPMLPVRRRDVATVRERTLSDGSVALALDGKDVVQAARALLSRGCETIAVCFINAYVNPENEKRAEAILCAELPEVPVAISSDLSREMGEFERFSSCVLNAYVMGSVGAYLASLEAMLAREGYRRRVHLMHSAGGLMTLENARRLPVRTVLSGPAAGVAAALHIGREAGLRKFITFDVGGTSTDICLIHDGEALLRSEGEIDGIQFFAPMLDVRSVGAGGGSIAGVDAVGSLSVGPRSAGSMPGPACYGRGGELATVTDANLVLGRQPARLDLGGDGSLALDAARADAAVGAVAGQLGIPPIKAAHSIVALAEQNMSDTIRQLVLEKGYDVRDFALIAFGGAGPLHGAAIARQLGMRCVLVPPAPGNVCALGALVSDFLATSRASFNTPLEQVDIAQLSALVGAQVADVRSQLVSGPGEQDDVQISVTLSMRYGDQVAGLDIPIADAATLSISETTARFREAYFRVYGDVREDPVEITHVSVMGRIPRAGRANEADGYSSREPADAPRLRVHLEGWCDAALIERERIPAGRSLRGPAIITEPGATTCIFPDQAFVVDARGNLVITPAAAPAPADLPVKEGKQ